MASNLRWDARSAMALTRSARSVQHTHPFCSSTSPGSSRSSAGVADQGAVDVERRDVVDDDGDAKVSGVLHDALEQRGLTGAEESGEEGHGDRGLHGHVWLKVVCTRGGFWGIYQTLCRSSQPRNLPRNVSFHEVRVQMDGRK